MSARPSHAETMVSARTWVTSSSDANARKVSPDQCARSRLISALSPHAELADASHTRVDTTVSAKTTLSIPHAQLVIIYEPEIM